MSHLHPTHYKFRHRNAAGELLWASNLSDADIAGLRYALDAEVLAAQSWTENALADEGENDILDVFFRGATAPSSLYFALLSANPSDTTTMATMTELAASNGYGRIAVARNTTDFPTLAPSSGDAQTTTATKTFTASGSWTGATDLALVTTSTGTAGRFIAWAALSATRTLINGDSLQVSMSIKLA